MITHILEQAEYYGDLTDYEKDVLETFDKLVKLIRISSDYYYSEHNEGLGGICIVKKEGLWVSYLEEKGTHHYSNTYDDVYDLITDLFDGMLYDNTCYCINNFPSKEEFKARHRQKIN